MINERERVHHYTRELHMNVVRGFDPPGTEYPEHAHEKTILYTVAGSLTLVLEGQKGPKKLTPGDEVVIAQNQLHSGVVGPDGWKYVAASDPKQAAQYPKIQR